MLGVASDDRVMVLEVVINGETLDWLWLQGIGGDLTGSAADGSSTEWMAMPVGEISLDCDLMTAHGPKSLRIAVLQRLVHGQRVELATVSVRVSAGVVSWSDFQTEDGWQPDLGPFHFDETEYRTACASA